MSDGIRYDWVEVAIILIIVVIIAVLAIFVLFNIEPNRSNLPILERCKQGECSLGLTCESGICKANIGSRCNVNTECVSEALGCVDGFCVARLLTQNGTETRTTSIAGIGQSCETINCESNLICESQICLVPENGVCNSNTDCTSLAPICENGRCVKKSIDTRICNNSTISNNTTNSSTTINPSTSCINSTRTRTSTTNPIIVNNPSTSCSNSTRTRIRVMLKNGILYVANRNVTQRVASNILYIGKYNSDYYCVNSSGNLYIIDIDRMRLREVSWWSNGKISHMSCSKDESTLWIQTNANGYLYHNGRFVDNQIISNGKRRVYGKDLFDFNEI